MEVGKKNVHKQKEIIRTKDRKEQNLMGLCNLTMKKKYNGMHKRT